MTDAMKWKNAREGVIEGIRKRDKQGGFKVYINSKLLSPKRSQKVYNHSPDGFNWSYLGSGSAQLALGILLEFLSEKEAIKYYQKFKQDIIARLPKGDFEIPISLVKNLVVFYKEREQKQKEVGKMKHKVSYEDLKDAFIDIVDGESASDLEGMTGDTFERCERIREIFDLLIEEDRENEKQ